MGDEMKKRINVEVDISVHEQLRRIQDKLFRSTGKKQSLAACLAHAISETANLEGIKV